MKTLVPEFNVSCPGVKKCKCGGLISHILYTSQGLKKAESISVQKEHLDPTENISTQKEHLDPKRTSRPKPTKVSLSIKEVQDQDLGSWKLSVVIARYSRRTLVDGNLSVWPLAMHHRRPSKMIVMEGGLFLALKHNNPPFSVFQSPRPSLVRLRCVCLSRNHIDSSSRSPTEIIPIALEPINSITHHFDKRGSMTSRGINGIIAANNQRFEGYINRGGMCDYVGHPPNDCPILQEPSPPFRPQVFQQDNMQFQQNINAIMQELRAQIGQLATMINQLQFEDFGQVPS
ncbi:hypothetical protein CR513_60988, partial [Mucuna pruriens]